MGNDFSTDHLKGESKKIAEVVRKVLGENADGGGCRAFYTNKEWKERGEEYGLNAKLILVHDGGSLARYCNLDYMDIAAYNKLEKALSEAGYWMESCTSWYSAVYKNHCT